MWTMQVQWTVELLGIMQTTNCLLKKSLPSELKTDRSFLKHLHVHLSTGQYMFILDPMLLNQIF